MVDSIVSVQSLRDAGYRVLVRHHRMYNRYANGKVKVDLLPNFEVGEGVRYCLPRGGMTEVTILDHDDNAYTGVSKCNPSDAYCKKLGVQLAIIDCLKKLYISKTQ
jgi:hypothetical protein